MQFLNPLFLIGTLAVIGPLIVHLIRKEEARKVPFSSLMFVSRVPKKSFRRQTIRHPLLLLLRMAALILLALAFARPFFVAEIPTPLNSSSDKSVVVLLDNSFSMQAGNRLEQAKAQAEKILDSLSGGSTIQVVLYSDTAQTLNNLQVEKSSLRSLLKGVQPTYRKTNHAAALKLAQQLLASAPNEPREIHWISDFQETGWTNSGEDTALSDNVRIQPYDLAEADVENLSVNQSQVTPFVQEESPLNRVSTRVSAQGITSPVTSTLSLEINGKRLQTRPVTVEAGGSKLVEFDAFSSPPGPSKGEVKLDRSDRLLADNIFHFTLNSQRKTKVLVLSEKGTRDSFYILKALSAGNNSTFQVEARDIGQGGTLDLSKYSAVVVNNVSSIPATLAKPLEEFVLSGGGLITLVGGRTRAAELNQRLQKVLPAKLTSKLGMGSDSQQRFIGEIQKLHPVFEIFQSVHHSYFMTTPFSAVFQSTPHESSQVLAKFEDGTPFLIAKGAGRGRSLLLTSSLNMEWNDLPLRSVFLPFLHQLVKYSTNFEEDRPAFGVGEVIPLSALNPMLGKALGRISATSSFSQSWKIVAPGGEAIELGDTDLLKAPYFTVEAPGFYESRIHNFENAVAVNIAPAESDLRKISPQQIMASLRRIAPPSSTVTAKSTSLDQRQASESKQRIWWYMLVVALSVLAVESFVSNRYYRGVSDAL